MSRLPTKFRFRLQSYKKNNSSTHFFKEKCILIKLIRKKY